MIIQKLTEGITRLAEKETDREKGGVFYDVTPVKRNGPAYTAKLTAEHPAFFTSGADC